MPDIVTSLNYLQDLPLYKNEKPYMVVLPATEGLNPKVIKTDNLEFESRDGIHVTDIRGREKEFQLITQGFEIIPNTSNLLNFRNLDDVQAYKRETEEVLKARFDAERVVCWDFKIRKNHTPVNSTINLKNQLEVEGPSAAAHVDTTFEASPSLICRHLSDEDKEQYLKPGRRIQMINTWRTLLPVLEDNPLAVCDYRSVDKNDLVAGDRVLPHEKGEFYYLKYNADQRWHWLSSMTRDELFLMKIYDTGAGTQANFCPHVSVHNPYASSDAPPRHSVETRSIVIT